MNYLFILITLSIPLFSIGQTLKEAKSAINRVHKLEQIEELKRTHPSWEIYEDKTLSSDSLISPNITNAKIGDLTIKQYNPDAPTYLVKILDEKDEELCKLKYIYLDGSILTIAQIDTLRKSILAKYQSGADFESLVKSYSMDNNTTGDLGWFYKGMMVDEFDNAVRNRKKDEIFTVDVTKNNWYYVVLKTHENKHEKVKVSIMIKYSK